LHLKQVTFAGKLLEFVMSDMTHMHTKTFTIVFGLSLVLYCGQLFADAATQPTDEQADKDKVYKTVGPDGETIYSDKPSTGSEEISVPKGGTYKPVKPPSNFQPYQSAPKNPPSKPVANSISVASPQDKETIWSAPGELTVSVSLTKSLGSGQQLEYLIDGNSMYTGTDSSHTFQNIFRGEHTVSVRLLDPSGSSLSSKPVTFYMRRPVAKH